MRGESKTWDERVLATPVDFYYSKDILIQATTRNTPDGEFISQGLCDWTNPNSSPVDANTIFSEASVGKTRYAGLAYMLQQEGMLDMQANAKEVFSSQRMKVHLDRKYPGAGMHARILTFFESGGSDKAKLVDFTTHHSGMGDFRMSEISSNGKGIAEGYTLPDVLKGEKPPARGPLINEGGNLYFREDPCQYGVYQYSNIGYMLLAEIMEEAYYHKTGVYKDYRTLLKDFMLAPIEGHAKNSGLVFRQTKFYTDLSVSDKICKTYWKDKSGKIVEANIFDGHLGAVGPFASHNDTASFFEEFFKGFPGTTEYKNNANKFFTDETIAQMCIEAKLNKGEKAAAYPLDLHPSASCDYYAAPGFMMEVDKASKKVLGYHKSGVVFGCHSFINFQAETGKVCRIVRATENVSAEVAKEAGVDIKVLMAAFSNKNGSYERHRMLECYNKGNIRAISEQINDSKAAQEVLKSINDSKESLSIGRR